MNWGVAYAPLNCGLKFQWTRKSRLRLSHRWTECQNCNRTFIVGDIMSRTHHKGHKCRMCWVYSGGIHGYLREVVDATRFLHATLHLEVLIKHLVGTLLPIPLYRSLYRVGPGQDILRCVKRMPAPGYVKSAFFKFHVGVLPLKHGWMRKVHLCLGPWFLPMQKARDHRTRVHRLLGRGLPNKFLWDVLQRTLKIFLDSHGIRFLAIENEGCVPYVFIMLFALHGI